ncbi:hypothetical protein [Paenibacillus sp. XY044]|uniref:hypothetical protein n=1 Tax=Paenibacillus sp. XY044 TaxID=2026089 RepID=UPI000B98FC47|nr:hypothetical protein [Paenibacillus sp. XY044]OZB96067.1 hypothetical protein CJP46_09090 [Paenibacillus sp. XY044]
MVPYRITLAVKEAQYLEGLLHYVHSSEFGDKLHISGFTKLDAFMKYMDGEETPDAVVGEAAFLEPWLARKNSESPNWILLGHGEAASIQGPVLPKYQPLPELMASIFGFCQKEGERHALPVTDGEAVTIGFVSVVGGSGKTTAAVNMAKQLGAAGLSVFYLNLETVNSSGIFPRPGRNAESAEGLPRMLYELKAAQEEKHAQAFVSPGPYTVHHPGIRADWFEPVTNLKELEQLGQSDTRKLLHSIAASGRYDVVIADTDSGANERLAAVLEGCRHLVWLMLDDIANLYKNGQWFAYMERSQPELFAELAGKSRYVVNRFTGQLTNQLPPFIPEVDGVLPNIPSWKQNSNEELLLSSPIYQRDILKLCKSVLGNLFVTDSGVRGYG